LKRLYLAQQKRVFNDQQTTNQRKYPGQFTGREVADPGYFFIQAEKIQNFARWQSYPSQQQERSTMSVYFIACTHFNHANIIRHCHRPFRSVQEMNAALVRNWNQVVKEKDTVFHIGDLAFGKNPLNWLNFLNGKVVFIKGNHDRWGLPCFIIHFHFLPDAFMLIHNPADTPRDWDGWVIHGHVHNNDLKRYPFINRERRTVNVSAEVVGYKPVSLGEIEEGIIG
jgi:calcineurin-like phosphoesterase family protein